MKRAGSKLGITNDATFEQALPNVHTVRFFGVKSGWEQWLMLASDRHHDSALSDRKLAATHLKKAVERDALIVEAGDIYDAMQSQDDKRQSKRELRQENVSSAYLDTLVTEAAKDFGPYAKRWLVMGKGNHDTKVRDKYGTDLVDRLAHAMRLEYGGVTQAGGYGGWVRFLFEVNQTKRQSIKLKYFHGSGGASAMTHGSGDVRRQASYLPDADIVLNGHTHTGYYVPIARERLRASGLIERDIVHFVRTPGYKNEYAQGSEGFAVEKGHTPKPLGCAWVRLYCDDGLVKTDVQLEVC